MSPFTNFLLSELVAVTIRCRCVLIFKYVFAFQQLIALVKALRDKLIEEKRSKIKLEMKIREEVCAEMAEQLVAIETAYR